MSGRRGFDPDDEKDFADTALPLLAAAARETAYLVERGYPRDTAITFVGNHHQLTARQRLFLARYVAGPSAASRRESRRLPLSAMAGRVVVVDGFNAIVTLEVALCGSPVLIGEDGTLRDLAGLKGTYHLVDNTETAVTLILDALGDNGAAAVRFLLDEPVSNSGNLAALIRRLGGGYPYPVEVQLSDTVDGVLSRSGDVVSSDSVILDHCSSWYDLDAELVRTLSDAWILDIRSSCENWT